MRILHVFLFSLHLLSMNNKILLASSGIKSRKGNNPEILVLLYTNRYLLAYSPCKIIITFGKFSKYVKNIFCAFSKYAERFDNTQKEIFTLSFAVFKEKKLRIIYFSLKEKLQQLSVFGYPERKCSPAY
jgi:hypothetical protein